MDFFKIKYTIPPITSSQTATIVVTAQPGIAASPANKWYGLLSTELLYTTYIKI